MKTNIAESLFGTGELEPDKPWTLVRFVGDRIPGLILQQTGNTSTDTNAFESHTDSMSADCDLP